METFILFQLLYIFKKKSFLSLICKNVPLTSISNEIQNTFVPFGSLNTLEQNISLTRASCPVLGRKRPLVRALSPSGD